MRSLAVLVVALVLSLGPIVAAGTEKNPEIRDRAQDFDPLYPGGPGIALGAPEIDLLKVWFDVDATTVRVNWQVLDASHRLQEDEAFGYGVTGRAGGESVSIHATIMPEITWGSIFVGDQSTHLEVDVEGDVFSVTFPRSVLPPDAPALTGIRAFATLSLRVSEDQWGGLPAPCFCDRAPDAGFGRDVPLG